MKYRFDRKLASWLIEHSRGTAVGTTHAIAESFVSRQTRFGWCKFVVFAQKKRVKNVTAFLAHCCRSAIAQLATKACHSWCRSLFATRSSEIRFFFLSQAFPPRKPETLISISLKNAKTKRKRESIKNCLRLWSMSAKKSIFGCTSGALARRRTTRTRRRILEPFAWWSHHRGLAKQFFAHLQDEKKNVFAKKLEKH